MSRIHNIIDSFTTGEISPKLRGRVDLAQYNNGVRTLQNFSIQPHGGITRRTGTKYVVEVRDSSKEVRLIPFEFSTEQTYILEAGDMYMRVFRNQGQILDAKNFANGSFAADISGWTDNSAGTGSIAWNTDHMDLIGVGGGNEAKAYQSFDLGIEQYTITATTNASLTYNVGSSIGASDIATGTINGTAQTFNFTLAQAGVVYLEFENGASSTVELDDVSLSNPIYTINTPYSESELEELQYAQSADVMYIIHKSHRIRKLSRLDNDLWVLEVADLTDGPYLDENLTATTLTPSGTSGSVTVTASAITGINANTGFKSTDVNRVLRWEDGTNWFEMTITAFTSTTVVTATIEGTLAVTTGTTKWRLGAFSDTTGYPRAISFHEQRLYFANTTDNPQTLWGSKAGNIGDFSPDNDLNTGEIDADTAVTFTLASTRANAIQWLASRDKMFAGTSGNIYAVSASSLNEAITPSNISVKPVVGIGCKHTLPVVVQNATLFIQSFGKKLMELGYVFEDDSFGAADLTILSNHITEEGLKYIERQESPDDIIWGVTTLGKLVGLTYLRKEKVVGWHQHVIGGDGAVETLASIPGSTQSELWVVVNRTIDGGTKRYVEFITEEFLEVKSDMWFVDSGLSFTSVDTATITGVTKANPAVVTTSGAHGYSDGDVLEITSVVGMTELNDKTFTIQNKTSTTFELKNTNSTSYTTYSSAGTVTKLVTSISGLDHLEGETVTILADAATHPTKVVSSGAVTFDRPTKTAVIGLGYESIIVTNALESPSKTGTIQGSIGRIHKVILRFHETLGGKFGYDTDSLDTILFRDGSDLMDSSPGLFSGDKILEFPRGQETSQIVTVKQDQPLPMSLLAIISKVQVSEV